MVNHYFTLFSNCIITKGAKLSTICDMQNGSVFLVPNDVIIIFNKLKNIKRKHFINHFEKETLDIIFEYILFFEENNLGFWTYNPKIFPDINKEWRHPSKITNSIIEINNQTNSKTINRTINNLNNLNCKAIEIRLIPESYFKLCEIKTILNFFNNTTIQHISLIIRFIDFEKNQNCNTLFMEFPRLYDVYIFNSFSDKNITINNKKVIRFLKRDFTNTTCGKVIKNKFTVNLLSFTEALAHNSCLNRKISIDANGNIKNCPSMPQSFGNIKDTTLKEALNHKDFKKYWNITKDQIDVCKDCEFRYICTDCRAYIENPNDIYSKPLKCGYNPYTNEWSEWSTNPLKQKAIKFYGMQELVKKKDAD